MKHFFSIADVDNLQGIVAEAIELKKTIGNFSTLGKGKTIGLIFFNSSLRTRLSTQKAAINLGMSVIVMNVGSDGWKLEMEDGAIMNGDAAEHIKDAARVMGAYCDIIAVRSFAGLKDRQKDYSEEVLKSFMKYADVPVVNLESSTLHPLQSLADLITIEEYKKVKRPKVVLTWAPHPKALPQAVPNSFVQWMKNADVDFVVTHPEGYELAPEFMEGVAVTNDQNNAFKDADFIYAKNWSSYQSYGQILNTDPAWTVSADKMALTNNAKFMHCLPVRRNVVVTDEVLDADYSIIIPEAKNRVTSAQVVLKRILENL
ncbi:MAG: N-acetylornithine carbamoyltransferase [Bacteroidetes bacterium]|nr:N-acetylornithine carbamoyltransferase [Bacteroidota bacterium]